MVHALQEAWRSLKNHGCLIDQRPLSIENPLDIVINGQKEYVGMLDMTLSVRHDIAADQAIEHVVNAGLFREMSAEQFQAAYYWKTVRGMVGDIRERWLDDVRIDRELYKHGYEVFRKHRSHARVRLLMTMKLTRYEKISL